MLTPTPLLLQPKHWKYSFIKTFYCLNNFFFICLSKFKQLCDRIFLVLFNNHFRPTSNFAPLPVILNVPHFAHTVCSCVCRTVLRTADTVCLCWSHCSAFGWYCVFVLVALFCILLTLCVYVGHTVLHFADTVCLCWSHCSAFCSHGVFVCLSYCSAYCWHCVFMLVALFCILLALCVYVGHTVLHFVHTVCYVS